MPNVKDCPGFETFGADVQQAREAIKMSRRELAEKISIDPRYLANIELCGTIPSVPVVSSSSVFASCPQNATSPRSCFGRTVSNASGQATNYSFARRSICPLWKVSLTEPSN